MGWSFRKSKSFGPFKLNLSKSGLGFSTGVKGARISFGPRGTYVNLGKNGIYYRKKIGGSQYNKRKIYNNTNDYKKDYSQQGKEEYIDAIHISDNASKSVFSMGIVKDINRARLAFWLWIIISIISFYLIKLWGLIPTLLSLILLCRLFTIRLHYRLDNEALLEWNKLIEVIYAMRTSKRIWIIEGVSYNSNSKINAGASRDLSRGEITVKRVKANDFTGLKVRLDVPTIVLDSFRCKILFLPNGIVVKKGLKIVAYSFDEINMVSSTTRFVEKGFIARDAEVVDRTWQFVNKNGTPDQRYKNNKSFRVCSYGTLSLQGSNLNIELQMSNKLVSANVDKAYNQYKKYINTLVKREYIPISQQIDENIVEEKQLTTNNITDDADYNSNTYIDEIEKVMRDKNIDDPYEDLFNIGEKEEENPDKINNVVDDLMGFFNEE